MVSLVVVFWMLVILFAVIGAMRGWAKELIVMFSIFLALFIIVVLETYVGIIQSSIVASGGRALFWFRSIIVILLVFFGYQTPNIRGIAGARFARERLQDTLLGFLLGGFNGYLVFGTLWYYLAQAGYPFNLVTAPPPTDPYYDAAVQLLSYMPPELLNIPWIYFAVGVAFVFVIIVFI